MHCIADGLYMSVMVNVL